ncbi:MAG: RlmE family RNA methyltransferase [Pseudomonadota bacterium]
MADRRGGRGGGRSLKTRVKTAKGRKLSSTLWLQRQLNDPYVALAQREGRRSRAAYKLLELDDRLCFLKPGLRVLDLGAAPGGWTQVAVERANALGDPGRAQGKVVGVDILEMEPIAGAELMQLDFLADDAEERVRAAIDGTADVVLSDMAAPATGHKQTDHLRIVALCETAAHFAAQVLTPGGVFVAKVLQGGAEGGLLNDLKRDFAKVAHLKPPASRKDSAEMYVIASGFRAAGALDSDAENPDTENPEAENPEASAAADGPGPEGRS